jgi:hypothetical protein
MQSADTLFWTYEWDAVVATQRAALREKVYGLTQADLEGRPAEEMAQALAEEFSLAPPRIFPDKITVSRGQATGRPERDFALLRATASAKAIIEVRLPFTGDPMMFAVRPASYDRQPPPGRAVQGYIQRLMAGRDLATERTASEIRAWAIAIGEWLALQADSLGSYPEDIGRLATKLVRQRGEELAAERELWADLQILKPSRANAG